MGTQRLVVVGAAAIVAFAGLCLVGIAIATSPGRGGPPIAARPAATSAMETAEPLPPAPDPSRPPRSVQPTSPVAPRPSPPPAAPPQAAEDDRPLAPAEAQRAEDPEGFRDRRQKDLTEPPNRRRGGGPRHTTAGEE